MDFSTHFPIWDKLTPAQQKTISQTSFQRSVSKGTVLHNGSVSCLGMLLILSGQLRSYIVSDEGREITLYRLFERDVCIFSASCVMQNIQFEVTIEAEKDSDGRICSNGKLLQSDHGKSLFRGNVADRTDYVEKL